MEKDVNYWKNKAEQYKQNLEATQQELDEFQAQSREYEHELETQLDQIEKKSNDLKSANERLTAERDILREKLDTVQSETRRQMSRMEDELQVTRAQRDEVTKNVRELEQTNDDLERAKRNVSALLDDLDRRFNETLERNALLESEVEDKDSLQMSIQRLRDESRDLKQELNVRERRDRPLSLSLANGQAPTASPESMDISTHSEHNGVLPGRGMPRSMTIDGAPPTRLPQAVQSPITPSARISALNIVGDLLRKVGALESKLASCRKLAAEDRTGGPEPKLPHLDSEASGRPASNHPKNGLFSKSRNHP